MIVVDASVAIKWLIAEAGHGEARALRAGPEELAAPDFIAVETANVLWKKVRRGEATQAQAAAALAVFPSLFDALIPTDGLVARALQTAIDLGHPVYDCLYLACAENLGAKVVTADARFALAARKSTVTVVTLTEWATKAP